MHPLVDFFTGGLFVGAIVIIIIAVSYIKRDKNIVTMIGIFGTFMGIVAGLFGFDVNDIDKSIPILIEGLKTAFLTSIAGLSASITLGYMEKAEDHKSNEDYSKEILSELKKLNSDNTNTNKLVTTELYKLNKNIGGEGDSSLLSQIQKLRTSFIDKNDELKNNSNNNHKEFIKVFEEFADKMARANTEELIKSIKKVMEDFNTKINDQLGESFKELTTGINNLLKWQNEYKENIISSTDALNLSKESLEKSSKGFDITVEKSKDFSNISEKLGDELKNLNDSLTIFKNGINEFDGVARNTKDMSEGMIKSIDSLTDNFVSKAEKMVGESEKQITMMQDSFSTMSKDLSKTHSDILGDLKQNVENINRNISEQFVRIGDELEKQVGTLDETFRKQFETFDDKLGEELTKSLSSLGNELTSVSRKFVSDYSELADKLERLINTTK